MRLCSIASGSSGNCIYVGSEATHLLVDVGISGKKAEAGLNSLGLTGRDGWHPGDPRTYGSCGGTGCHGEKI